MPSVALNPGEPGVIETLRNATRSCHAKLELCPAMVRLFDPGYSLSEYRAHLGRLLGLIEPLEWAVTFAAHPPDPVCSIKRSLQLREDLQHMGVTQREIDKIERCRRLPKITNAGLRGYNYVILGSLLGGKVIARQLRATLGPDASLQFYGDAKACYGALWASFCQDLEENGKSDLPIICQTAVALFHLYGEWFSDPLPGTGAR